MKCYEDICTFARLKLSATASCRERSQDYYLESGRGGLKNSSLLLLKISVYLVTQYFVYNGLWFYGWHRKISGAPDPNDPLGYVPASYKRTMAVT